MWKEELNLRMVVGIHFCANFLCEESKISRFQEEQLDCLDLTTRTIVNEGISQLWGDARYAYGCGKERTCNYSSRDQSRDPGKYFFGLFYFF